MPKTVIANVRPWGGSPSDVVLAGGRISGVIPAGGAPAAGSEVIDGGGGLLLPAFSDVHVHLDSNRLGLPFRPQTGERGRWGRIMNDRANWRTAERPVAQRADHALGLMISKGATRVRSHAQVDADTGLEKLNGVLAAREAHRHRADVQVVAFPQVGIHLEKGVTELLDEALRLGADLVGGIDPCEIDRDPVRHVDTVFDLASRNGKPIDIHLHEPGTRGLFSLSLITERVRALGMQGMVTISHAFCLVDNVLPGLRREAEAAVDTLAELDIAVTTVAPGGGLDLPVRRLTDAGVRVGLGMDGQRDYWSPYGDGDMLARTYQLAFTQDFDYTEELELAMAVGTWGGATVIDATRRRVAVGQVPGLAAGDPGDLVIVPGETVGSAVVDRPAERLVIHDGRVVARGGDLV